MGQQTGAGPALKSSAALERPVVAALYVIAVLVVGGAAVRAVLRAHEDRMWLRTGGAEWIWYAPPGNEPHPLRFYATRGIELPRAPARATVKLFVDREHVLYVNGERTGSGTQRPGDALIVYDIARQLRAGINLIAIEAASATGAGGVLLALDIEGYGRDAVVTNGLWRVDLSPEAIRSGGRYRPLVWGPPPQYPWGYPRMPLPDAGARNAGSGGD